MTDLNLVLLIFYTYITNSNMVIMLYKMPLPIPKTQGNKVVRS